MSVMALLTCIHKRSKPESQLEYSPEAVCGFTQFLQTDARAMS